MGFWVLGYQSRTYYFNVAILSLYGFFHLSPVLAYELLSRCKFDSLLFSRSHAFRYPLQKNQNKRVHPVENRTPDSAALRVTGVQLQVLYSTLSGEEVRANCIQLLLLLLIHIFIVLSLELKKLW